MSGVFQCIARDTVYCFFFTRDNADRGFNDATPEACYMYAKYIGICRYFLRKKAPGQIDHRIKNVRFIGELVKFRVRVVKLGSTGINSLS